MKHAKGRKWLPLLLLIGCPVFLIAGLLFYLIGGNWAMGILLAIFSLLSLSLALALAPGMKPPVRLGGRIGAGVFTGLSNSHPLAKKGVITLAELKKQKMILRTPASATRMLFESTLESNNVSVGDFNITLEVDNIATIKDLIRKNLGVSILPHSACLDELKKGKLTALPIENLSMVRETRILYNRDFTHMDILSDIMKNYRSLETG